jgi:hypothetical protein
MLKLRVNAIAVRVAVAGALVAGAVAMSSGPALATGLTSHRVAGFQSEVSCLTTALCVVAGYDNKGVGDVVEVRNGVPGHVSVVRHTQGIYSVSCPNKFGCVALGRPTNDIGALFITINGRGQVTGSKPVKVPAGVTIDRIFCSRLRTCAVAGTNFFASPIGIEVGSWNGSKLSLHRVAPPKGSTDTVIEGISCWGTSCEMVGYADKVAVVHGLTLAVNRGKPGRLRTVNGDSLYGVSCVSRSRCYAVGFDRDGGVVLTLNGGVAGSPQATRSDLFAIACTGSACTAAGEQLGGTAFVGTLVAVAAGRVTSSQVVSASGGYDGDGAVARVRGVVTAVGPAHRGGSEITTG